MASEQQDNEVGDRISKRLLERGMKQADLATATQLKAYEISRIINGKRRPSLQSLELIASALDMPLADLVRGTSEEAFLTTAEQHVARSDYEQVLAGYNKAQHELVELHAQLEEVTRERDRLASERQKLESAAIALVESREEIDRFRGKLDESRSHVFKLQLTVQAQAGEIHAKANTIDLLSESLSRTQADFSALCDSYNEIYRNYYELSAKYHEAALPRADAGAMFIAGLVGMGLGALATTAVTSASKPRKRR